MKNKKGIAVIFGLDNKDSFNYVDEIMKLIKENSD